jgi:hypothetical protein
MWGSRDVPDCCVWCVSHVKLDQSLAPLPALDSSSALSLLGRVLGGGADTNSDAPQGTDFSPLGSRYDVHHFCEKYVLPSPYTLHL